MFPGIPYTEFELPEISLEQFEEINEQELNCIFAETGADREVDFNHEGGTEELYFNNKYPQLIRTREAYAKAKEKIL